MFGFENSSHLAQYKRSCHQTAINYSRTLGIKSFIKRLASSGGRGPFYINTLFVQKILSEKEWLDKMQSEDFRGLTPLFYGHITPYGEFQLDMNKRINIEETI
jgi:hypothetical protein